MFEDLKLSGRTAQRFGGIKPLRTDERDSRRIIIIFLPSHNSCALAHPVLSLSTEHWRGRGEEKWRSDRLFFAPASPSVTAGSSFHLVCDARSRDSTRCSTPLPRWPPPRQHLPPQADGRNETERKWNRLGATNKEYHCGNVGRSQRHKERGADHRSELGRSESLQSERKVATRLR